MTQVSTGNKAKVSPPKLLTTKRESQNVAFTKPQSTSQLNQPLSKNPNFQATQRSPTRQMYGVGAPPSTTTAGQHRTIFTKLQKSNSTEAMKLADRFFMSQHGKSAKPVLCEIPEQRVKKPNQVIVNLYESVGLHKSKETRKRHP